jgi:hypothetical protein
LYNRRRGFEKGGKRKKAVGDEEKSQFKKGQN